ncbi:hypothetical protein [Acinetobacter sp.]|uniref:hypothetical protein n=1 Tax=Acinetobacter sp. TaxID=472 RepID=UPI0035AF0877
MLTYQSKNFTDLYNTDHGQKLWNFLNTDRAKIQMETASDLKKPALLGIEKDLLKLGLMQKNSTSFNDDEKKEYDRTKQMLGSMVKQVMASLGYIIYSNNIKTPHSNIFYSATMYEER